MAKRKTGRRKPARKSPKPRRATRSAKRPTRRPTPKPKAKKRAKKPVRSARPRKTTKRSADRTAAPARLTPARLSRERRTLDDVVPTPPSSLDMERHGSAVRTGRAEMAQQRANHASMTPHINAGDVDVNVEDAYFVGDESPGGDNPTPDQDVVDEIGKALGVEYQDAEELRGSDKVADRDKHRWELDPASAEDYENHK